MFHPSEQLFHQLLCLVREVFWLLDLKREEFIYVSPAYQAIWGRAPESLYQSFRSWIDAVHPENRERIAEAIQRGKRGCGYDEAYRIVLPNGSVRWIHENAFPIRNASGEIDRIAGGSGDIPEHKELE